MKNRIIFGITAITLVIIYALACGKSGPVDKGSSVDRGSSASGAKISANAWWNPGGNTIVVSVQMKNTGNKAATGIRFDVTCPGYLPKSLDYGTLNPGQSATAPIQLGFKPPHAGTIKVKIRGDNFSTVSLNIDYKPLR